MKPDMLALDDFEELKRKVERIKRRRDEAKGAHRQLLTRLQKYGVKTLKEAETLLQKMLTEQHKVYQKYAGKKAAFQKKHAKVLKDL